MTTTEPRYLLFVGTNGYVRALDKRTGVTVWDIRLPDTDHRLVTLLVEGLVIYAGCSGKLFALDARDGKVLWRDDLKGLWYDHMTLATMRTSSNPVPQVNASEDDETKSGGDAVTE
jgi:outer membrane protein assembly factor BamB